MIPFSARTKLSEIQNEPNLQEVQLPGILLRDCAGGWDSRLEESYEQNVKKTESRETMLKKKQLRAEYNAQVY